jgi:hypothetical protein
MQIYYRRRAAFRAVAGTVRVASSSGECRSTVASLARLRWLVLAVGWSLKSRL